MSDKNWHKNKDTTYSFDIRQQTMKETSAWSSLKLANYYNCLLPPWHGLLSGLAAFALATIVRMVLSEMGYRGPGPFFLTLIGVFLASYVYYHVRNDNRTTRQIVFSGDKLRFTMKRRTEEVTITAIHKSRLKKYNSSGLKVLSVETHIERQIFFVWAPSGISEFAENYQRLRHHLQEILGPKFEYIK